MLSWSKIPLAYRFLIAFGAVGLLYLPIAIGSFYNDRKQATLIDHQDRLFKLESINDALVMADQNLRGALLQAVIQDVAQMQKTQSALEKNRQLFEKSLLANARYFDEDPKAFLQRLDEPLSQFSQLLTQGRREAAIALLANVIQPMVDEFMQGIQENLAKARNDTVRESNAVLQTLDNMTLWIDLMAVAGLVLVLLISWLFARYMTRLLGSEPEEAVSFAQKMAAGDVPRLQVKSGDTTSLASALDRMGETFQRFIKAQKEMEHQHNEEGNINYRMPAEEFPGIYGQMARRINKLVDGHIQVKMKVIDVVQRYARGDLAVSLERFPGQRAVLHEAVDQIRDRLLSVKNDIEKLAREAARGNFAVRGNVDKYENDFKEMVESLNRLMDVSAKSLNDAIKIFKALARGDLTQTVESQYAGLLNELKESANETVANLRTLIGQLIETANGTANAVTEIAAGNNDLSQRTEQQASSIEELSSSMEELSTTAKQNATHAKSVDETAQNAESLALEGGQAVDEVVQMMQAIHESAKRISEIIYFMDNIAFQTNILALNASVEAAHAGEHGRGFAVLAGEVRNLAQRSANSAKEIKGLIGDSLEKVEKGVELVDGTGKIIENIVSSIQQVSHAVSDITTATAEQSQSIEEVNQAILQMDRITQQNSSLVEELAAAAAHLKSLAGDMAASAAVFKLDRNIKNTIKESAPKSMAVADTAGGSKKAIGKKAKEESEIEPEWEEF
jgi:methyl-accepting chemotaxis protein